ncbi:MAG: flagellar assembly protein FliH [Spongiibacteraceae bacterium]|nr:flagellar assembly protein FliH [Spongiibacteraceae bacterium]
MSSENRMNTTDDSLDSSEFDIRLLDRSECVSWNPPSVSAFDSPQAGTEEDLAAHFEDARQRGLEEGRAQGEAEYRQRNRQLAELVAALTQPLADIDAIVEQELSELALMIGQQLCRQQLKIQPLQIIDVVRDGIARLPVANSPIRIALNPEDAALVAASGEMEPSWQLVEDPDMARGGCELKTESSRIDDSMETRLSELLGNLFGEDLPQQGSEPQ